MNLYNFYKKPEELNGYERSYTLVLKTTKPWDDDMADDFIENQEIATLDDYSLLDSYHLEVVLGTNDCALDSRLKASFEKAIKRFEQRL